MHVPICSFKPMSLYFVIFGRRLRSIAISCNIYIYIYRYIHILPYIATQQFSTPNVWQCSQGTGEALLGCQQEPEPRKAMGAPLE